MAGYVSLRQRSYNIIVKAEAKCNNIDISKYVLSDIGRQILRGIFDCLADLHVNHRTHGSICLDNILVKEEKIYGEVFYKVMLSTPMREEGPNPISEFRLQTWLRSFRVLLVQSQS